MAKNIKREWADFGFDEKIKEKIKGGNVDDQNPNPIKPSDGEYLIEELACMPPIRNNKATLRLGSTVQWGEGYGAMRVVLSPLGSLKATIKRSINDLKGETKWICKKVYPLNNEFKQEKSCSLIYESTYREMDKKIDAPKEKYEDFDVLANYLINKCKRTFPSYCMFPTGFKQIREHYYKLMFEYKGSGLEAPSAKKVERFDIDLCFYPEKGLTRCWGYEINSAKNVRDWKIQPSEWDEYFAPTQDINEIVECVSNIFMTY